MRYINETIAYSRYNDIIKKLEIVNSGYLTLYDSTFTPTFAFGMSDSPYLYSYEGRAVYADKNKDMKLSGIFDYTRNIYLTDKLMVTLDGYLAVSTDNTNWTMFKLPNSRQIILTYSNYHSSYIFFKNSICTSINSPLLISNSAYPNFALPDDFLSLPTAIDSNSGIGEIGYICNSTGYWSPKPIYHLCNSGYLDPKFSPFKVANSSITDISIFDGLGKHWVDNIWSWEWYDYVGAYVNDYEKVQFFSCSNGEIAFRLLASWELLPDNTIQATSIVIPADIVYNIVQYKFIYDKDSINQTASSMVIFEKYYAVTNNGVYELTWNGISFDHTFVLVDTFDTVLFYDTEYKSKWNSYGTAIVDTEVHKLHIYCKNGKHIVIDTSDKLQDSIYGSFNLGIEFKSFTFKATENDLFTSVDNKLYKLNGYNSLELIATLNFNVNIIHNRWILTDNILYYLDNELGMSNAINPYYTKLDSTINTSSYPVYYSTRYDRQISIFHDSLNNSYILFDYDYKYEYTTNDFVTFNEQECINVPYISSASSIPQITSIIWLNGIKYFIATYSDYPIFRKESNNYIAGFYNESVINPKYALVYNNLILSEVEDYDYSYYLRNLISCYSEQSVGILKSNEIEASVSYEQPEYLLATLTVRTNLYKSSYQYYKSQVIILSGTAHHVLVKATIRQLDDNSVYEQVIGDLNFSSGIKVLFINIPENYIDHYLDIKFYAKKSYSYSYPNMKFSITVHKIANIDFKVNDSLGVRRLYCNDYIVNDFNISTNYTLAGNWQSVSNSFIQYYVSLEELLGFSTDVEINYNLYYDGVYVYLIKRILVSRESVYSNNYTGITSIVYFNNGVESEVLDQNTINWFETINASLLNVNSSMGVLTINPNGINLLLNRLEVNSTKGTIDFKYPASTTFTELISVGSNRLAINDNGYVSLETRSSSAITYAAVYGWNNYIQMQKISDYSLTDAIYLVVNSKTRYIICNSNGEILHTDSMYHNWISTKLSLYRLNRLIHFDKNGSKVAVCGNNGELYISSDYANNFVKITTPISTDITSISYFGTKLYIFSTSIICFSDDLTNWTILGHTLEFKPLTSYISSGVLYIGCKNGVIVKTNDGIYWSYVSSNIDADINKFVYAIGGINYYYPNPVSYSLVANFTSEANYNKIHDGDSIYFNNNEITTYEVVNTSIDGFSTVPAYTGTSVVPLGKIHLWTDVLINPKFKLYTDGNCTNELQQQQLYEAISHSITDTSTYYTLEVVFESIEAISTISFICGYFLLYANNVSKTIEFSSRLSVVNNNSAIFHIDYTDIPTGYSITTEGMKFIGIPNNSLWLNYFASNDETIISSLYLKLIDDTLYDNLTITSRSQFSSTRFLFNSLIWSFIPYDSSKLHGFNRTRALIPRENSGYWPMRSYYSSQTIIKDTEVALSDSILRYIAIGSYSTYGGVFGIISSIVKQPSSKYIIDINYPGGITPYHNAVSLDGVYAKQNLVTISGLASLSLGDRSGNYYVIKAIDCSFKELKNLTNGIVIFNNRCYSKQQLSDGDHLGVGWYYISDTSVAIYEFYYYENYRVTYRVPIEAYTGQVSYIKLEDNFGYTTDSLQPLYDFEPGNLEFSLDSEPDNWENILELPQMIKNSIIKVNIKQSRVNFKPGLLANIVSIHGVEYLV